MRYKPFLKHLNSICAFWGVRLVTLRRYMVSMAWLVAIGVVCVRYDQVIDNLAPFGTTTSESLFLVKPYLSTPWIGRF